MAKPHTYHMISFEDRPTTPPPPYFLDQTLADPVLNLPERVAIVSEVKAIARLVNFTCECFNVPLTFQSQSFKTREAFSVSQLIKFSDHSEAQYWLRRKHENQNGLPIRLTEWITI